MCRWKSPSQTTSSAGGEPALDAGAALDTNYVADAIDTSRLLENMRSYPPEGCPNNGQKPRQKKGEVHVPKGVPEVDEERMKQKRKRDKKLHESGDEP